MPLLRAIFQNQFPSWVEKSLNTIKLRTQPECEYFFGILDFITNLSTFEVCYKHVNSVIMDFKERLNQARTKRRLSQGKLTSANAPDTNVDFLISGSLNYLVDAEINNKEFPLRLKRAERLQKKKEIR